MDIDKIVDTAFEWNMNDLKRKSNIVIECKCLLII